MTRPDPREIRALAKRLVGHSPPEVAKQLRHIARGEVTSHELPGYFQVIAEAVRDDKSDRTPPHLRLEVMTWLSTHGTHGKFRAGEPPAKRIEIQVTLAEWEALKDAARRSGLSGGVAGFVRRAALLAAERGFGEAGPAV